MGGLFGIGGSSAKTDRKFQLKSWGDLLGQGESNVTKGSTDIGTGKNYWQAILSGDPTKMSAALAPQISAIKGQTGQQIAGIQQFSGRSGGSSAAVNDINIQAQTAIQNLFDMLGPEAAKQLTGIGEFETATGTTQLANVAEGSGAARPGDQALQQEQQAAVMEGLVSLFGG